MTPLRGSGPVDGAAGYATAWLDLRAAADARARSHDLLTAALTRVRRPRTDDGGVLRVLDVGCGTGAMASWVAGAPGTGPTRWLLLDPDPSLLRVAHERLDADGTEVGAAVTGTVDDLPDLLTGAGRRVDLVVASALLDVLPSAALPRLAGAVAATGTPFLAALTVTGEVHLDPTDPGDALARACVTRTATADGAAGPGAAALLVAAAEAAGTPTRTRHTPWRLRPGVDDALLRAWWDGYAAAAVAGVASAGERAAVAAWLARREPAVRAGRVAVVVDHTDVLLLPGAGVAG